MILKASQRSGAKQLGLHLLKTEENEHVEVHEVRGFVSESVLGAMKEAYAVSCGTRCKQHLFSLSLSPPETESVRAEVFEKALDAIEVKLGLVGQPRVVVFHEKEGRRHAHAVWSRIDAHTMTARQLSFFKQKLQDVSRQLFLENGWKMPLGLVSRGAGDPRNFTLAEWQQAKRTGRDPKATKELIQQCWAASDDRGSFEKALEERGMFLAKGDRRGHVIVTFDGEVLSIAPAIKKRTKDVAARLGGSDNLRSVEETRKFIGEAVAPRIAEHIRIAKRNAASSTKPLLDKRHEMGVQHRMEREKLDLGQRQRWSHETAERASRLRNGIAGIWDRLSGERSKTIRRNEFEATFAMRRDREQRDRLVSDQLMERQALQNLIRTKRREGAAVVLSLFADAARFRSTANTANLSANFRSNASRGGFDGRGSPKSDISPELR